MEQAPFLQPISSDYFRQCSPHPVGTSGTRPSVVVMKALDQLKRGDLIRVTDSTGAVRTKRALGPCIDGGSFQVVWACREEEWQAALAEERDPEGMPWPAEDVRLAEVVTA